MQFNVKRFVDKREESKLSQRELARAASLPIHAISNIEGGRVKSPKYSVIAAIARALGVKPEYFFDQPTGSKQRKNRKVAA